MRTLLPSLNDHSLAMLRGIAELRGVDLTTNVRSDAAAQLAAQLAEPAVTETALASCSPAALDAWRGLAAAGGRMKTPVFTRRFGVIRPVGPGKLEREQLWRSPDSPVEELWYRGLIFRAFADLGEGPAEYIYIPDDLLPPPAPSTPAATAPRPPSLAPTQPPARVWQAFNTLAVDLCGLLAAIRETPPRVDRAGQLQPADRERLQDGLLIQDAARFVLMITLARERGWLTTAGGRLTVEAAASTAWLRTMPWEGISALFVAWRDSTDLAAGGSGWNDLRHIPALQVEGVWRNDPLLARRAILGLLHGLPADDWYAIADLVAWVKVANPDFQRPDGNYTGWYLRERASDRYLSGFESWDDVEGRLVAFLIQGPLFWLGAVALGLAEDGQITSFQVTPFGAAWLAGTTPPELPRPARLTVADDFSISAPLWLPLLDRFRLLRFTEPVPGRHELGEPTRHRITRGSLARARASGVKAEAILGFLQRATGGHVPPRVAAGLARWGQHGGAVRISRGAVLRVEDASTLAALRGDPVIAPLLGDLLSAQAVLVSDADLPRLLKTLEELGYTARVE